MFDSMFLLSYPQHIATLNNVLLHAVAIIATSIQTIRNTAVSAILTADLG